MSRASTFGVLLLPALAIAVVAQQDPSFDVVSIKPNRSGSLQRNFDDAPGGRFTASNVSLGDMIRVSYGVRPAGQAYSDVMNGAVPWLSGDHFDVRAITDQQPSRAQLQAMIRSLLRDRFHLRVHTISHEEPVFELRLLRDDGRLGSGLRPSPLTCDGPSADCLLTNRPGKIAATGAPIEALTHMLSGWLDGHPEVRDRTGLTGRFAIDLTWTPTEPVRVPLGVVAPPIDPDGASLVTAVREQLGLKLVPARVDVPILVVDGAEKPTPD